MHDCRRSPRGGRGLKSPDSVILIDEVGSLPARGAWVEIPSVAFFDGNRDRRSPRGGRGLKLLIVHPVISKVLVAPREGGVG